MHSKYRAGTEAEDVGAGSRFLMLAVNYSNTPLKMELLSQPRRLQMKYSSPRTIDMSVFDSLSVALVYKKEFSCLVVVANNKQSDRLRNPCLC